jgi:hypothetical protein
MMNLGPQFTLVEEERRIPPISASHLERALTRRLIISEEEESVHLPLNHDAHWLKCTSAKMPFGTILGIAEELQDENIKLHITVYRAVGGNNEKGGRLSSDTHSDWKRNPLITSQPKDIKTTKFFDFRNFKSLHFPNKASVVHFLQYILGTDHYSSPWSCNSSVKKKTDIILLCLKESNEMLSNFRVSDASPSWSLHSQSVYDLLEDDFWTHTMERPSAGSEKRGVIYTFKRLPDRPLLSVQPPESVTSATTVGCLWETVRINIDTGKEEGEEEKEKKEEESILETEHRLVCPPYVNLEQEYSSSVVEQLFSPEALDIFRTEVLRIPLWTPWPETQHYSVSSSQHADNPERPWTVFPLCYCFPANQPQNINWVKSTKTFCPRTCQILQSVEKNGLLVRTALFSQLAPESTLEAHTGWADLANHVLRLHIPLIVPPGNLCGTWVDGCVETHATGRPLLFDDSKIHRAFNYHPTDSRIVLIVDLARPEPLPRGYATGGHSKELDSFIQQMNIPR